MYKKLLVIFFFLILLGGASAFCLFGLFGDCGSGPIIILDKNVTNIDQNIVQDGNGLTWSELNTVIPWQDDNVSDDITVSNYVRSDIWNVQWPLPDANILSNIRYKQDASCDSNSDCIITGDISGAVGLTVDTNAQTACSDLEYLAGDGSCLSIQDHNHMAFDVNVDILAGATYTNLQEFINFQSVGKISGGALSSNGDGTVAVTAGTGMIKTTDSAVGNLVFFDWDANASVSLTDDSLNYVYVDYDTGTENVTIGSTTSLEAINNHTRFAVGFAFRKGNTVEVVQDGVLLDDFISGEWHRLEHRGIERMSGGIIAESGERYLTVTEGTYYKNSTHITTSAFDSNGVDSFFNVYRDGGGDWTFQADQNQFSNILYDDGDGTPGDVGVGKYAVYWVYQCLEGDIYLQFAQVGNYNLIQANAAQPPTSPNYLSQFAFLSGKIIIMNGATNAIDVINTSTTTFVPLASNIHNELAGLQGGAAAEYYHLTAANYGFIDQDVTSGSSPTFDGTNFSGYSLQQAYDSNGLLDLNKSQNNEVVLGFGLPRTVDFYGNPEFAIWDTSEPINVGSSNKWSFYNDNPGGIAIQYYSDQVYLEYNDNTTDFGHGIFSQDSTEDYVYWTDTRGIAWDIASDGNFYPDTDNRTDLGNVTNRWRNLYSIGIFTDDVNAVNDVNATRGNFVDLTVSGTSNLGNVSISTDQITVDVINGLNDNNILFNNQIQADRGVFGASDVTGIDVTNSVASTGTNAKILFSSKVTGGFASGIIHNSSGDAEFFNMASGSGSTIFGGGVTDDAVRRFRITTLGKLDWGDGTAQPDWALARASSTIMELTKGANDKAEFRITNTDTGTSADSQIVLRSGASSRWAFGNNAGNTNSFDIITGNTIGAAPAMSITAATGNIGFGKLAAATDVEISASAPELRLTSSKNGEWTIGEVATSLSFYGSDGSAPGAGVKGRINTEATATQGGTFDMVFYTHEVDRGRIKSGGNWYIANDLSIGTTTASSDLTLKTSSQATLTTFEGSMFLISTGAAGDGAYGPGIIFSGASGAVQANRGASITSIQDTSDADSTGLTFNVHGVAFDAPRIEAMRITSGKLVGIGTSEPEEVLHVVATTNDVPIMSERSHTTTNAEIDLLKMKAVSLGDMADGFGGALQFYIEDDSAVEREVGRIQYSRDGADTEGALRFLAGTNGVEEFMTIKSTGLVGIGTASPDQHLEVEGTGNQIIQANSLNTVGDTAFLMAENGTVIGGIFNDHSDSKLRIANWLAEPIEFSTDRGGTETIAMTILDGGNIGIGIATPDTALHIDSGAVNQVLHLQSTDDTAVIKIEDDDTINYITSRQGLFTLGSSPGTDFTKLLSVRADGAVGIGTATPTAKVEIVGDLHLSDGAARIFKVDQSIADTTGNTLTINSGQPGAVSLDTTGTASGTLSIIVPDGADTGGVDNDGGDGGDIIITAGSGGEGGVSSGSGGEGGDIQLNPGDVGGGDTAGASNGRLIITLQTGGDDEDGQIIVVNLPTSDPSIAGALYSNSGTIMISAG